MELVEKLFKEMKERKGCGVFNVFMYSVFI